MANRFDAAHEERPAGRQHQLDPRYRARRERQEAMPAHRESDAEDGQRQRPPETAREVLQLRIALVLERRHLGLERHAADRAVAGLQPADLRMHRADVDRRARHYPPSNAACAVLAGAARSASARCNLRRCISRKATGITNIDNIGAVIMPPTIGAAIRRITSDPVPLPHMIGSRPAMITATVIALGRTRSTAPSKMAASSAESVRSPRAPPTPARGRAPSRRRIPPPRRRAR